jgi:hypothetical protein
MLDVPRASGLRPARRGALVLQGGLAMKPARL